MYHKQQWEINMKWVVVLTVLLFIETSAQHSAFSSLPSRYDPFDKVTTYSPYLRADLFRPLMYLSIVEGQNTTLVINFQYVGDSWIWFKRAQVLINGEVLDYDLKSSAREVLQNGNVFEHGFALVRTDARILSTLKQIKANSIVSVKLSGKVPYVFQLDMQDCNTIEQYINAYDNYLKQTSANSNSHTDSGGQNPFVIIGAFTLVVGSLIYAAFRHYNKQEEIKNYIEQRYYERDKE